MVTIKQIKAKLKKLGIKKEQYESLKLKADLEALLAQHEGGGNGGNGGGGNGGGTVTMAAAAAGVKSHSPQSAAASAASTKKAKSFLKRSVAKFGTVKSHANLAVGGKKGVMRISPPRGNKTRKATKMEVEKSPEFAASIDTKWKPKPMFKTRKVSPVSPTEQEITYKNGFKFPVMLKQSMLPPSFVPRKAAISKIPGHNFPLDPGASIKFKVTKGNTLYVHDERGNLKEYLHTKAHPKFGKEEEWRYGPTRVGIVPSHFTKGQITKIKKSQSGGRRTRRRRRGRRRCRTRR